MWENHDSCVETNLKLNETAAFAVQNQMCLDISSQKDNRQSGFYIFKKTCKYLKMFGHLCTCDGEHRGLDSFCPVYQNCSAAKGGTQGFQVVIKGQLCSVSDTSAEEKDYILSHSIKAAY